MVPRILTSVLARGEWVLYPRRRNLHCPMGAGTDPEELKQTKKTPAAAEIQIRNGAARSASTICTDCFRTRLK